MKKQMKLFLFALLVVLLVATMAVVVSAAGDATYTEGTHYYKVTIEGTDNYYANLNAAIADVPNGGTIYVLADVPAQTAVTLTKTPGFAYTITSEGTAKYTITMSGGTASTNSFSLNEGDVTFKKVAFADGGATWQTLLHSTGNSWATSGFPSLTLEDVTVEGYSSKYGIWMHQRCDLTIKNSTIANDYGDCLRFNNASGKAVITLTGSTLTGVGTSAFLFQSTNALSIDTCTINGIMRTVDYSLSKMVIKNSTINGYIQLSAHAKNSDTPHNLTVENTTINATGNALVLSVKPGSVTLTNVTVSLKTGAKLISNSAYGSAVSVNGLTLTLSGGAYAPAASEYKAFTLTSATVTDTAVFTLASITGTQSIGTQADLVKAIKADASYAAYTIPEAWHPIVMDNDDLKIILSGDALALQGSETPFISGTKGTLIAITKGVTTYVEGTHFFKTNIEGTDYYYADLYDALDEVINDGTITLLANVEMAAPSLGVEKTYTIDGNGFAIISTPASLTYGNDITGGAASPQAGTPFHIYKGDVTLKNLTVELAQGTTATVLIYVQNYYRDPAKVKITLDGVTMQFASKYGVWLHQEATLHIKGTENKLTPGTTNLVRIQGGANASIVTVDGGTFETTVNTSYLFEMAGPGCTLNILGGTFKTSGGGVQLSGAGATLNVSGDTYMTSSHANWAHTIKISKSNGTVNLSDNVVIEHTAKNAYTIGMANGATGLKLNMTGNVTVRMTVEAQTFALYGNVAKVKIEGGTYSSNGDTVFGCYDSAEFSVKDATISGNRAFYFATNTTYVKADFKGDNVFDIKYSLFQVGCAFSTNPVTEPNFTVTTEKPLEFKGAVLRVTKENANIWFKGGSYVNSGSASDPYSFHIASAKNANLTVEGVTLTSTAKGGVFYINSGAAGATLTVKNGTYTAPKMIYSYGQGTFFVESGTFTSNATNNEHFIHVPISGTTLNISGGTFTGNADNASLITCNEGASASLGTKDKLINITGGTFDGGQLWIFCNSMATINISNATFKDTNNTLNATGAIRLRTGEPSKQNDEGTLNLEQEINLVITSGSFSTHQDSNVAIFWAEEETITVNGGTFNANRIVAFNKGGCVEAATVNFNGGLYYVRGDKAIVSANCYDASNAEIDVVNVKGGTFVIAGEESTFIYGADSDFAAINIERMTLYTAAKTPVLYGKLANNALYTYVEGTKQVTANGLGKYAGKLYNVYTMGVATDDTLDVSNSDQQFEGASIWVSSNASITGIRFYTVLSAEAQETIASLEGSEFVFGTIIAPADYVAVAGAFTVEALEKLSVSGEKYVKIPAKYAIRDEDGNGIPEAYSAALVNIKEKNFTRGFAAISYVEVDGEIYYGAYDFEKNVRNIRDVSKEILASGQYTEDQINALATFAGFKANESALVATTWNAGKINATGAIEAATGYVYSDVIHLAKAGTTLTVIDADGNFAGADTTVFSQWTAEGVTADNADNYLATDKAVAYKYGNTTAYTYTSSFDNEYIRVSYAVNTTPAVYMQVTTSVGTLKGNQARYDAYRINQLVNGTYEAALEGLHVVAIGDSYFDDPNVTPYTWIEQLARKYSMTLDNYGISGSTIAADEREDVDGKGVTRGSNPMINRVYGLEEQENGKGDLVVIDQTADDTVDIVFFDGGRNDLTRGVELGEQTIDNEDITTVCGAMNMIIANLRELYPNAIIIGINPWAVDRTYTLDYNGDGVIGIDENGDGEISSAEKALESHTQIEYSTAVKAMFELNEVVCFDLTDKEATGVDMDSAAFREANCKGFSDISHLNAYGAARFLSKIEAFVADQYEAFVG